jgi:hypothetical protein
MVRSVQPQLEYVVQQRATTFTRAKPMRGKQAAKPDTQQPVYL